MTVKKLSSSPKRALSKKRAVLLAGCAATVLLTVSACGGGTADTTDKDGFAQAPQKDGALTVWVDATRMDAAKLYQKLHPEVKLDIVSYDGDANGSNYLQTKVQLFNRTGKGWPDVVFSSQNNEASWAVDAGFAAPLNKGLVDEATLGGFAEGSQRRLHGRGHRLLSAQRPLPGGALVQRAAAEAVRLHGADHLGGVPAAR